jgi:uncharacterized protein (TIGR00369 family)
VTNPREQLSPLAHSAQNHCFGCGPASEVGLKLEFSVTLANEVVCFAQISNHYEGPPGYLHGGIIATILDEAMSKSNRAHGKTAMTRQMQVEYLRPVPSNAPIRIEGKLTRLEGRKLFTEARILNPEGVTLASATALFLVVTPPPPTPDPNP